MLGFASCKKEATPINNTANASANTITQTTQEPVCEPIRIEFGLPIDSYRVDTFTVQNGETLGKMLSNLGATKKQINSINLLSTEDFDVRTIRAGKTYYALYQKDTAGVEKWWF
jgi:hypothetical protein